MSQKKYGITSIGINLPKYVMSMQELAKLRNIDPNKLLVGLGCNKMSLCMNDNDIVDLATDAAKRALSRWDGDLNDIGLIAVGTESAIDMSRPLSAWVADKLGLKGAVRSYEVKHACYGGTVAVRQALEWKLSGVAKNKSALVIAADISLYNEGEASEATQGAGAIAMIIGEPRIAQIDPISFPWSKPAFDFWRPVGREHPLVEGEFSLKCYEEAVIECFRNMIGHADPEEVFNKFQAFCFHTPFPKMVKKAVYALLRSYQWPDERIDKMFRDKVEPTMEWNRLCGNAYTASLWIAVANTLRKLKQGQSFAAFSYGSGCGAELLTLKAGPLVSSKGWCDDVDEDIIKREEIDGTKYLDLRKHVHER